MGNKSATDHTLITTQMTPVIDQFSDDLIVVVIWSLILIYALITNTLTLIGIFRSKKMRQATSYWIVASLAVCDWFMIVISLVHIIPATYWHDSFVEIISSRTIGAMFVYNVFWYTGVIQLAAMAVNRFVSIVYPLQYKRIFAPRNTILILMVLYIFGLLASVPALHPCCYIVYDHKIYVTYYWPQESHYFILDILINTISVLTMILCYAAILMRVRKSSVRRRRYQLAANAGAASGAVLLMAAASVATRSYINNTTKTTPLLNRDEEKKKPTNSNNWVKLRHHSVFVGGSADKKLSVANLCSKPPSLEFKSVDKEANFRAKRASMSDRRRSLTSPNLLTYTSINNSSTTSTSVVSPTSPSSVQQKPNSVLIALQKQPDQQQQATRREIRLFVQFFVVSLVFLSTWVTWQWLPRIPDASKWVYFATTTFFFINNAVNPTVYLIFNSGLRHQVKDVLSCNWSRRVGRRRRMKNGHRLGNDSASNTGTTRAAGKNISSSSD